MLTPIRILFLSIVTLALAPAWSAEDPAPGTLEVVAELPINPGNLAVTADGRVFATVHQFRRAQAQLIEITGRDSYVPWPNAAWNGAFGSGPDVLNSVLGIAIDRRGRLWVIDNGLGEPNQPPKLIAFSLESGEPVFRYDFPADTAPVGSFLNDLAVDDERGFVYIADVGGAADPALVTVDLNADTSHRFTASKALQAEDVDLVVEGRVIRLLGKDGPKPARIRRAAPGQQPGATGAGRPSAMARRLELRRTPLALHRRQPAPPDTGAQRGNGGRRAALSGHAG